VTGPALQGEAATQQGAFDYDVIIPTRDRSPAFLDAAIQSVIDQTLPANRIIVVVDGNVAGGARIVERWPDVVVVQLPQARGAAVARDRGVAASRSEWVCFLDDDDLWRPRKMEVTAAYLRAHPHCQAVRSPYFLFTEPGEVDEFNGQFIDFHVSDPSALERLAATTQPRNDFSYLDIAGDSLGLLLERNRGVTGTTCVRRSLLNSLRPVPVGLSPGEDHVLFCLVATRAEWELIDSPLMFYRVHAGQDTQRRTRGAARRLIRSRRIAWDLCGAFAPRPLAAYGETYRREFRALLWGVLRHEGLRESMRTYRASTELLPRLRDRLALLVPEPIAWRWRHRATLRQGGMHV